MASIHERKNEKGQTTYRVQIRTKGVLICKTFESKEGAELFVYYKENLIKEMENFEVPDKELVRLKDIKELYALENPRGNSRSFELESWKQIEKFLPLDTAVGEVTLEKLKDIIPKLLQIKIRRGGDYSKNSGGISKTVAPRTVRRYLADISTCFTFAITKGMNISNPFKESLSYFTNTYLKIQGDSR